ncbi:MAG: VWA domain-containing protein [bacterium]
MIRWGEPVYLWLMTALPALAVLLFLLTRAKRRRLARLVGAGLLPRLVPEQARWLEQLRNLLLVLALGFLLLAAARPKWGEELQLYQGRGIDVVVALDASKSMRAEDVKPDRLARAKAEIAALLDDLRGNAVGIVAFAGEALALCPLTPDVDAARLFLDIIDPDAMPVPGTDYGKAIDAALGLFNPAENTHKALVFVTDGEDHGRNTAQAVQRAMDAGVLIFPVAFATVEGAPIPVYDERGGLKEYRRDRDGNIVISRLDERVLIAIARQTGGRFFRVEGFSAARLRAELDRIRKKEIGGGTFTDYIERFPTFLAIALGLFVAALGANDRRGAWLKLKPRMRAKPGTGARYEETVS